ncbi:MAG: response regulator [Boseongicola sp.]|nr:response regulator [Boseongicola sp.]
MPARLVRIGASDRHGRAVGVLIGLGLVVVLVTTLLFFKLQERQNSVAESVREDSMWAVFQTHREAAKLIEATYLAMADPTPEGLGAINSRFDLLYSRGTILRSGYFATRLADTDALWQTASATMAALTEMAALIDPIANDPEAMRAALPEILAQAQDIRDKSNRLVIRTNEHLDVQRVRDREAAIGNYHQLAIGVAAMTIIFIGIVALQFTQRTSIRYTQRQLRHLSIRNERSAKNAKAANEAKSMFLATMSHEIRTPLNGILGASDLLRDTPLSDEQNARVSTIRRSGHLLLDVINDVLDFSKLDAHKVSYTLAPMSLPELAETIQTVLKPRAQDAGLDFRVSFPAKTVTTDAVRLRQVLVNLIGNAIKFTSQGHISVKAHILEDQSLRIEVEDTGTGISEQDQNKLFINFNQLDSSASRKFAGTGLGLAISKRIITDLGGTIGVDSLPDVGSTFWLELPVSDISATQGVSQHVDSKDFEKQTHFDTSILLVEDNAINREVATALLQRFGATVSVAVNGEEAIEKVAADTYDLVFMDLQMPVLDGIAATRALRKKGAQVPIVALTANAFADDQRQCLEAGMNDFVAKPITREKIHSILQKFATATSQTDERPLLDQSHITSLEVEMGRELMQHLLDDMDRDSHELIQTAKASAENDDAQAHDAALHTLQGAAATLGLKALALDVKRLRKATKNEPESYDALRDLVTASIAQTRTALAIDPG